MEVPTVAPDLEDRVIRVVTEVTGSRPEDLDAPLQLDSLTHAELVLALEEALGRRIPDDAELTSVRRAVEELEATPPAAGDPPFLLSDGFGRMQGAGSALLAPLLDRYYRMRIVGADRVPATGPVVLAANHDSLLDIPALVRASPRPVWFMAKVELYRGAVVSRLFHALGGFPVRRGAKDVRAVRTGLEVLRGGRVLGMYPEATRSLEFRPFLPGAAWMSVATGAPLVPVGILGTAASMPRGARVPRRSTVTVAFGDPLPVEREAEARARLRSARELTARLREAVARLLEAPR